MRTSDFDYRLPPELIAQTPLEPRDSSRLLVLHRSPRPTEHRGFPDILEYLDPGDVMVFNRSRVIPARLRGRRDGGGPVELLLLRREATGIWRALAKPARRLPPGSRVLVESGQGDPVTIEVLASHGDGVKTVDLGSDDAVETLGETPLPPYIREPLADPRRYQTVYAAEPGSAAAPTAGLHFTEELLDRLAAAGVEQAFVTLHVGLDTFRPVRGEDPAQHDIHTEYFEFGEDAAEALRRARSRGNRIVAVGTTVVRVLEQAAKLAVGRGEPGLTAASGNADLFILPGHEFRAVDALLTNFHLPRSTLLMLVSAFAGRERVLEAYGEAIRRRYRFYSFGDAMLVL